MKAKNFDKQIINFTRKRVKHFEQKIKDLQKERKKEKSNTKTYAILTREITRVKTWLKNDKRFLNGAFAKSVKTKTIKTQKQRKNK